jgi:hypothetical protein
MLPCHVGFFVFFPFFLILLKKKNRALKEHPDKGGNKEKYQALQNAYEVLADDDKKSM